MPKTSSTMGDIYDIILGKPCLNCGNELSYDNFYKSKGYTSNYCKKCYYLRRDPEKHRKNRRDYCKRNPDLIKIKNHNYIALKKGAKGYLIEGDVAYIKALYSNCCAYCGIDSLPLTVDHLWPISLANKNLDISKFATNELDNIVPACAFCNRAKRDKPFIIFLGWKNERLQ